MRGRDHFSARRMTQANVDALTRDDMVDFHKKYWRPENIEISTDIDVTDSGCRSERKASTEQLDVRVVKERRIVKEQRYLGIVDYKVRPDGPTGIARVVVDVVPEGQAFRRLHGERDVAVKTRNIVAGPAFHGVARVTCHQHRKKKSKQSSHRDSR